MSDLTIKAIKGFYNTKTFTDEQISAYKKHGSELIDGEKFMCIHESLTLSIIMNSNGIAMQSIAMELRSKLGFNQYDLIMTEEQSAMDLICILLSIN